MSNRKSDSRTAGSPSAPKVVCGLCVTLPLLVVFKLRFLERVTVVVITAGHIESFPRWRVRGPGAAPPLGFIRVDLDDDGDTSPALVAGWRNRCADARSDAPAS
jgi:hypothetical protein